MTPGSGVFDVRDVELVVATFLWGQLSFDCIKDILSLGIKVAHKFNVGYP